MLKIERDILNFKAAISRAKRRAMSLGVPVAIRRRDVPFPAEGDEWEIVYDDCRQQDFKTDDTLADEYEARWAIEATEAFLDEWGDRYPMRTGRISRPGGTVYTLTDYAYDESNEDD